MTERVYRLLLRLLPTSFRNEYGDMMVADFAERHRSGGAFGRLLLWLESLPDVVVTALREHAAVLRQDLRLAARSFRRTPGYALVTIAILALGVGANTAIFTVVDHALVRPLPYPDADRLVQLWESAPQKGYDEVEPSPANFNDWVVQNDVFAAMGAYAPASRNLTDDGRPERVAGQQVTSGLFAVLRTPAALGRTLLAEDDDPATSPVIVLSHRFWLGRFGGDAAILGRTLRLDDTVHEVVGVMPPSFHFPRPDVAFWVPLRMSPYDWQDRSNYYLNVVARLDDGVTLDQAAAGMKVVAQRLAAAYPDTNTDTSVLLRSLRDETSRRSRTALMLLFAAAAGVLLIGCANLANLLFARAAERRQELGVRVALGAGTERLVRQILTENLSLALVGGGLGLLAARMLLPALSHLVPENLPIADSLTLDARVLVFGLLLALVTGVAFALYPAWQLSREATSSALREGGRHGVGGHRSRMRGGLVVAEVAVSVVLLFGTGLLIRALWRVSTVDPGFRTENVVTLRTHLPLTRYPETVDRERFYEEVLSRVRALPGVEAAGYTGFLPFVVRGILWPVGIDGDPASDGDGPPPLAVFREVTEGYLETLGLSVVQGRTFAAVDSIDSTKVAVVNQAFVERFWPDRDPVGRTFEFRVPWMQDRYTVVGVVPDVRVRSLEQTPMAQAFVLHRQLEVASYHAPRDLAVRHDGAAGRLLPELRRIVHDVDPEQPVSDVRTLASVVRGETTDRRHQLRLLGAFAVLAFVMAGLGVYGVLAFLVSQRRQEIGVRIALGARAGDVAQLVVGRGFALTSAGLTLGLAGGLALGHAMRHVLFGVEPFDVPVLVASGLSCALAALVACCVPAWRAARVDPLKVLRE